MKRFLLLAMATGAAMALGCSGAKGKTAEGSTPVTESTNPLLAEWDTPFGVPPFDEIDDEDYLPAFAVAIEAHRAEVEAIAKSAEPPTFENTVAALDYSGRLLERVSNVFFPKNSADTNDRIQEIAKEIAPQLSAHRDGIMMNAELFARVKAVHDGRGELGLGAEQLRLLEETYKDFVAGGAELNDEDKARLTEINQRLSVLGLQFGENLLDENNRFKLVIEKREELAGLPETSIAAAADAAEEAGLEGQWVFTLHKPSWIPFLQFSDRRDYRRQMFEGYIERGNHGDDLDNKQLVAEMVVLRIERAELLGHATHAHKVLERNMAKTPDRVYELLNQLWRAAEKVTRAEAAALQELIAKDIPGAELEPWDWWYYTEKLRKQKFDLSDEELRPYFQLENVQRGAFEVATELFQIRFVPRDDLPLYHEEARTVEVEDEDGTHLGILYLDYHPRASKRQGAWMTEYRGQQVRDGERVTPVVVNVFNFTRATDDKPALLSLEEVETLFHEFGHALHGLLSDVTYPGLAGTSVARDFVELPSQFMEHWAVEPSVIKTYALHCETGEPIPDELIEKITKAEHFNQGFETTEYLAASFLDMDWHTLEQDPGQIDVLEFEEKSLDGIGLTEDIVSRYRSTYFAHIFAGGYSAGYYSYIWSAVLDSDAFAAFEEAPELFDAETARKYREFILSAGNTADPMELYVKFRGKEPSIEPLLEKRGLK